MKKRLLALLLVAVMLFSVLPTALASASEQNSQNDPLKLWYDEPAPAVQDLSIDIGGKEGAKIWENWSLPLGNGYFGISVFGGAESELMSVTDVSMYQTYSWAPDYAGGLNVLAMTHIDFGHTNVSNYTRDLSLDEAIAHVQYDCDGVTYTREYFTSYPDRVMAMKLSADQAGKLDFTLRPEIPYLRENGIVPGDGKIKTGTVSAEGDTITLSGTMEYFQLNFEAQYKVIPVGGTMTANEDGTITVAGADSAVILMAEGTNYHLSPQVFAGGAKERLDPDEEPHAAVSGYLNAAVAKGYDALKQAHLEDYQNLFDRVELDLGGQFSAEKTTDQLLAAYRSGTADPYLEELLFQYGRYLMIASSREGGLPATLQGTWNYKESPDWSAFYAFNINFQMNYWPSFTTNLAECFIPAMDLMEAFREQAQRNADSYVAASSPATAKPAGTGANGWCVGAGVSPFGVEGISVVSHTGPGSGGFSADLFWQYYDFTRDLEYLEQSGYPALLGAARLLSQTVDNHDGKWLVRNSASPENAESFGYAMTTGCAFDQQMVWQNYYEVLEAARILNDTDPLLTTLRDQMDHLDHVIVGKSGHVKEYREEEYYGDIGEYAHRHISQLVGLYPGTSITSETDAWLDAAKVSLTERGDGTSGWSVAHRLCCWARLKEGDQAYHILQHLMKHNVMDNMWDAHPPFQIDGNFGATAGIAEMLLQSHEGYIEPLAALPGAWSTGSYTGLTARGNFEVDASWANGQADSFVIRSKSGGPCRVKYANIANAIVTDENGNAVTVTAEGADLITFQTEQGGSYTITTIPVHTKTAAPANLDVETAANNDGYVMSWEPSADAASYNVYRALNSESTYTLVASGVGDTTYTYTPDDIADEDQMTLRVTAVAANGRESKGNTALVLPAITTRNVLLNKPVTADREIINEDLRLSLVNDGELGTRMAVKDAPGSWSMEFDLEGFYSLKQLSFYELEYATTRSTNTKVEVLGPDGQWVVASRGFSLAPNSWVETELNDVVGSKIRITFDLDNQSASSASIYEITCTGLPVGGNVLLGKPAEASRRVLTEQGFTIGMVNDGTAENDSNRLAVTDDNYSGPWTLEFDLEGTYQLGELQINGFWYSDVRSRNTKVEVLGTDGSWTTVASGFGLKSRDWTPVDMNNAVGSRIRITFDLNNESTASASIYEITCSGVPYTQTNILLNKPAVADRPDTGGCVLSMVNDGSLETRMAVQDAPGPWTMTFDLEDTYTVEKLRFLEYENAGTTRSSSTKVEILAADGVWKTVASNFSLNCRNWVEVPLTNAIGSKLRITFDVNNQSTASATIYEITATGALCDEVPSLQTAALQEAIAAARAVDVTKYTEGTAAALQAALANAESVLADPSADQEQVDAAAKTLTDAIAALEPAEVNVLLNKPAMASRTIIPGLPTEMVNDGIAGDDGNRLAVTDENYSGPWTLEFDLEGTYQLGEMRINGFWYSDVRSKNTMVEVLGTDGNWTTVASGFGLKARDWTSVNMNHVIGSKIKITFDVDNESTAAASIYEITCIGTPYTETNILLNKPATPSRTVIPGLPPEMVNDGIAGDDSNRLAVTDTDYSGPWTLEFDLEGTYQLGEMRINGFWYSDVRSKNTKVEVLGTDGSWTTVASGFGLKARDWTSVNMNHVVGSKIKITFDVDNESTASASIYEITCMGTPYTPDELTVAKTAAKAELETYKNADDYRDAQQAELSTAISAGKAAIDAAADAAAVHAALAEAKAAIDEIKTAAELDAEEEAADKAAAAAVDAAIDAIGDVTLDDEAAILAAREAYASLNDNAKGKVTKLAVLEAAESTLAELKAAAEQEAADKAAAANADALIEAINVDDKATIDAARTAYDALTDAQKAYVTKYAELEAAELHWTTVNTEVSLTLTGPDTVNAYHGPAVYTLSAEKMVNLGTILLELEISDAYLTDPVVEAVGEGWFIITYTYEDGKLTVILGHNEGAFDASDLCTLTLTPREKAGHAVVSVKSAQLAAYLGEYDETFVPVDLSGASVTTYVEYNVYDVNKDGTVNLLDMTRAQRYYGKTDKDEGWNAHADVNRDGEVNVDDLVLILNNYMVLPA